MKTMKTNVALALAAALSVGGVALAGPASAVPPVNHDDSGHVHHVWLGNGQCHQIDSVTWDIADNGMHRGANSSGPSRGPWHGPCPVDPTLTDGRDAFGSGTAQEGERQAGRPQQ